MGYWSTDSLVNRLLVNILLIGGVVAVVILMWFWARAQVKKHFDVADEETQKEHLSIMFAHFDKAGGGIDREELGSVIQKVDAKMTETEITDLFTAADADSSGKLSVEQFIDAAVRRPDVLP